MPPIDIDATVIANARLSSDLVRAFQLPLLALQLLQALPQLD